MSLEMDGVNLVGIGEDLLVTAVESASLESHSFFTGSTYSSAMS